ncbi:hypothetical protein A3L23_04910 (plasmid) [Rhodococcoides fascians D188]|nr:hypothetical protein A3L23_04910 [Rhodococcus fascians D188]
MLGILPLRNLLIGNRHVTLSPVHRHIGLPSTPIRTRGSDHLSATEALPSLGEEFRHSKVDRLQQSTIMPAEVDTSSTGKYSGVGTSAAA